MGLSIWHILVMLIVLILVFGTSRIKTLGRDLGTAMKDFRHSINDDSAMIGNSQDDLKQNHKTTQVAQGK
ncbi:MULTISPECIES: twin-arginine translocase TatA/TatE family subunit [Acinetobacter]|jgi:sec-independent protein translocase protein TatA|uniref:twin-arginine translocase TatA/TatE family subunit n=1 Tax=Acinetobacter TaxID=469 RepID=UPI00124FD546|nr:twin-arginine translocase TatA/TatE family subunit [Acinetobacter soli]WEH91601.1 twin-arginine translocase TatA/TatE family subunit [Acinetobacter soli]WEH96948.1 twin-arginine translocase TatA/TatE family subunit [Acinetobacter soli]WEI00127.1 twin-arginine translocase TatA/TatE family subunit [Acinetobacter soli]